MPLATPPVFDGWADTQANRRDRPLAKTVAPEAPTPASSHRTPTLVGQSPVMRKLFSVIERVAPTEASVLITGATGTGKELAARAIHNMSPRRDQAFVDINCSAIPETLIEAELFGHQRGTFTGAHENRSGLFEKASGGTLFLDEVDALNLSAQAKLLRVLQERTVRRIGARANIAIDVRIISATNCDLAQAVAAGRFRPDLYYRLRVLPLHLPELCTRTGDVTLLVDYFLRMKSERHGRPSVPRFTPEAMRTLNEYPWPGNVRELENVIEYALALGLEDELGVGDLPPEILNAQRQPGTDNFRQLLEAYMNDTVPLAEVEKRYILTVLQQFGGNQVRAAAALGIDRSKLYRRLKQYGVMAVRFLQEEDLNGLQLLSRREMMEGNGAGH
jgi:two-component system nitrogen regulation response regulator NtrX